VERRGRFGRGSRAAALILGCAGAAVLAAAPGSASSVRSVSMTEMLAGAELVFEGRVLERRTVEGADYRGVRTCVRFEVLDVVKGAPVASPLELCFAGGRSKIGVTRHIAGLEMPDPGEHGIYFVDSLDEPRLNPFYGWAQGHFRVSPGPLEVVSTATGRAVLALDPGRESTSSGISNGVARGAVVAELGARAAQAPLDAAAFKARLRVLLEEGR
jgi:hypothetical protein